MGCEHSRQASKERMEIEIQIQEIKADRKFKILLLGTGNCGKSTLFKQIRQIYSDGFDEEYDKKGSLAMNRENCINGMLTLISKADLLYHTDRELHRDCYIYQSNDETKQHIEALKQYREQRFDQDSLLLLSNQDWIAMKGSLMYLWSLPEIKAVYKKQEYFSIFPNLSYFLNRIYQLFDENYVSTVKDVIEGDIRTTGLVNFEISINDNVFVFYDTGGQRNERKKWIHQFDNVDGVIFVAALDHYATVLFEDEDVNAMKESLACFDEICNGKWFRKSEMVLLLTRTDLFKQRLIDGVTLNYCFEDYDGDSFVNGGNMELEDTDTNQPFQEYYECALKYIKNEYRKLNKNKYKTIYIHVCDTHNQECVEKTLWDVQNILITSTLKYGCIV